MNVDLKEIVQMIGSKLLCENYLNQRILNYLDTFFNLGKIMMTI